MHVLPQLGKLERRYPDDLVIIGVESPKYPAESIPENVLNAVRRLGVEHPVLVDADHRVWDSYAVRAWPTLVFISPSGEVLASHAGEVPYEALESVVGQIIEEYRSHGGISSTRIDLGLREWHPSPAALAFPGKVLATTSGLFIADSRNRRILIADLDGNVRDIAGSGEAGTSSGQFEVASFVSPQGMALSNAGVLYVADADSHTVRALDLDRRQVITVAGTGQQAMRLVRRGPALETSLSSPFDLALSGSTLFIAMAGLHQVWSLDLEARQVAVWAGTGHEGIRDGERQSAWLAQPMGLDMYDDVLYVACAETQAIRAVDLSSGTVDTVVGSGLFEFGDADGSRDEALFQHSQSVARNGDVLYVADTYNNKIRSVDLTSGQVTSPYGSGAGGHLDGPGPGARFDEPGDISLHSGTVYVADTNNHAIRTIGIDTGHVRTLRISGLPS